MAPAPSNSTGQTYALLEAAVGAMAWTWTWRLKLALMVVILVATTGMYWGRNRRLQRLQMLSQCKADAAGTLGASDLTADPIVELVRGLKKMLLELQSLVTEEGAMMRQGMLFEDLQARIQAVVNKAVANSKAREKLIQRLDTVHAGLARTAANLHKEGMDTIEIEDYLQTLKKDLQDFFQKAGQSHNEDLVKKLDTVLKKAFEKLKSDLEASLVTCTTTIQGDFNAPKKNQSLFGSAMADKFQEVLKEMAKNYDHVQKVCKETRDLVRRQSQLEALQGRTDHLPDRLCILRDTLNDTQQLVLDVKGLAEDLQGHMEDKSQQERADQSSPPHAGWQPHPGVPTMLNLDEQLPMLVGRPALTPLTLQDGRVICIPRAMLSQLLGGAL